jgi:hypothetical protein
MTIVFNRKAQLRIVKYDLHNGLCGARMLQRIVQQFLYDTVSRQLNIARQTPDAAPDLCMYLQAVSFV